MDLKALLNMDMTTLGQLFRRGLDWWTGELAALVPAGWRARLGRRRLFVTIAGGRPAFGRFTAGRWQGETGPARGGQATFLVAEDAVLIGDFDYPAASAADLRRMIGFDLDRLAPLPAEDALFDIDTGPVSDGREGFRRVTLAVMRRQRLEADLALLATAGVRVQGAGIADGTGRLRFDFTRELGAAAPSRGGRAAMALRVALPVLLVANLGLLVLRDEFALASLREAVEGQRLQVDRIERLRRDVDREEARRRELLDLAARQAPLPVLDALTRALPDGAFATRLDWDGRQIRVAGQAPADLAVADLIAATGRFEAPKPSADAEGGAGHFDLSASARVLP